VRRHRELDRRAADGAHPDEKLVGEPLGGDDESLTPTIA
jgi:hypothetical protein